MTTHRFEVAVIRGDGIGVDVTDATVAVVEAARERIGGFALSYRNLLAGAAYFRETGADIAPGAGRPRRRPTRSCSGQGRLVPTTHACTFVRKRCENTASPWESL